MFEFKIKNAIKTNLKKLVYKDCGVLPIVLEYIIKHFCGTSSV